MTKFIVVLLLLITFLDAKSLGMHEKLGAMVPLDLTFLNEDGKNVTLRKLMNGKPTILTLNYYRCAGICTVQLNDLASVVSQLDLAENTDYKIVTVSFAEEEPYQLAAKKRKKIMASITRPFVEDAWHFVIGENNSSSKLADLVGYGFEKKVFKKTGLTEYVHPAATIILSPEGKITRYLDGIGELPFDVKMALIEAADGKVGPTIAKTLLFSFVYDAEKKKYVFAWEKVIGTGMSLAAIGLLIWLLLSARKSKTPLAKEEYYAKQEENHHKKGENDE